MHRSVLAIAAVMAVSGSAAWGCAALAADEAGDWLEYAEGAGQSMAVSVDGYAFDRSKGEALLDLMIAYKTPLPGSKPVTFLLKQLDLDCAKRLVRDEANMAFSADTAAVSMSETPTAWEPFPAASTPVGGLLAAACTGTLPTAGIKFHGTDEALMRDMARRLNGGK